LVPEGGAMNTEPPEKGKWTVVVCAFNCVPSAAVIKSVTNTRSDLMVLSFLG
jgi:hypothetical protein